MPKGTVGFMVNSYPIQEKVYRVESGFYPRGISKNADLMSFYWMERNRNMVQNVLEAVKSKQKTVVFYGASHLKPVYELLQISSPYKIIGLPELPNWKYDSEKKFQSLTDE